MTDPYANIRRALEMLESEANPKRWTQALTELRLACDPDTIRALVDERDALREDACVALVADIRFACGDNGKRMHPELVEFIRQLAEDAARYQWLRARWGRIAETYEDDRLIFIGDEKDGEGWDTDAESLDAAIDQARGKAGGEVEGG